VHCQERKYSNFLEHFVNANSLRALQIKCTGFLLSMNEMAEIKFGETIHCILAPYIYHCAFQNMTNSFFSSVQIYGHAKNTAKPKKALFLLLNN